MAPHSWTTRQPGRLIWIVWALVSNTVQLPIWMVYLLFPSLRPNPEWTYKQALLVRIMKAVIYNIAILEMKPPMGPQPGKTGNKFAIIHPAASEKYVGAVAQDPEIQPVAIGGNWYPSRPATASEVGDVVLHFHGGAYVIGDGSPQDADFTMKAFLNNTSVTHAFWPQYRLASHPNGRFPAALQDAITTLLYLTETFGIPANRIIVSGDSAGGHLCLALLRYIADNPDLKLPNPCCAWLWSPWTDPQVYLREGGFDEYPNTSTDILTEELGVWGTKAMAPSEASGMTLAHPNICFVGTAFKTATPLFFSIGDCEVLYHDGVKTAEELKAVPGNKVELNIDLNAVHDIIMMGPIVGFEKEAVLSAKRAGDFLTKCR